MATVLTTTYDSTSSSNAIAMTIASLATSSGLVAGRQSDLVDNTSNLYIDAIVSGQITSGTTPTTAKQIILYVWAPIKVATGTFSYPTATTTALGVSDAAATFEAEQLCALRQIWAASPNTTSDRVYTIPPTGIAQFFGGVLPLKWGLWLTHNTVAALNATAGNHFLHYTGVKFTST